MECQTMRRGEITSHIRTNVLKGLMRASQLTRITLFAAFTRSVRGFQPIHSLTVSHTLSVLYPHVLKSSTSMCMSSASGDVARPTLKHIGKTEMSAILEEVADSSTEDNGFVVIDVRNQDEITFTGKLSEDVHTLPLPVIMQMNVFALDEDDFEEVCGFQKPSLDETLVFSCAAGIRSVHAANFAAQAGYSKLVNYAGGANEWFYS